MRYTLNIDYENISNQEELSEKEKILTQKAKEASYKAYAPYSNFTVGACVLLANGEYITGNNQENAAYPSGMCAERVALFAASAMYPNVAVESIAVFSGVIDKKENAIISPCGGCRQTMAEYENISNQPITVLLCGSKEIIKLKGINSLLPFMFTNKDLEKK